MVFKPFTTLARQSISRHLVNGYAQSVVAATQSSYASSTIPIKFGQSNAPAKIQNAFGGAHSGRAAPKDGSGSESVSAFYAAQSSADDKEERKYLFSKKILWSKAQHQQQQKQLLGNPPEPIAEPIPARSRSTSFVSATAEEPAAELQAAVSKEAESAIAEETVVVDVEPEATPSKEPQQSLADVLLQEPAPSPATREFNAQLQALRDQGRWEEVSVLFRHMADQGIAANAATYNLLLDSTIGSEPLHVAQVIDVYSAMLREKLIPTTTTYRLLIDFLATRALRSLKLANDAERDAQRFGVTLQTKMREVEAMKEEGAMDYALSLFYNSTEVRTDRVFPSAVYEKLIHACSKYKRDEDMLKVYTHMEAHGVAPTSEIIRSLIRGFGRTGDVRAAIETYNNWMQMDMAQDPAKMDQRYQVYTDLIKAYMDVGDSAGALAFLEKVVEISHEHARLEWLKQAVVEGFVSQGDVAAAKRWTAHLSIQLTPNEWLAHLMTRTADQDELDFSRQIYNTINFGNASANPQNIRNLYNPENRDQTNSQNPKNTDPQTFGSADQNYLDMNLTSAQQAVRHTTDVAYSAQCKVAGLALCIRSGNIDLARDLWRDLWHDLWKLDVAVGPNVTAAVAYTQLLFQKGHVNEAVVVLKQFSSIFNEFLTNTPGVMPMSDIHRSVLKEGFDYTCIHLADLGLLTPSIGLDVAGFGYLHTDGLGYEASKRVLELFDNGRLMGLTAPQLSLVLQLQYTVMMHMHQQGISMSVEDYTRFKAIFFLALHHNFPVSGASGEALDMGSVIVSPHLPELSEKWAEYVEKNRSSHTSLPDPILTSLPVVSFPPTPAASSCSEDIADPYWDKTDVRTSNAIDNLLDRSKYNKIADLRRMYRSTRRAGMTLRLITLGKIIQAAARSPAHEDFIDEVFRNAKVDCPLVMTNQASHFGWSQLYDAMVAAQLTLGHRDKASAYHDEMLLVGAAPSANTYGLYIVSLKNTHKTYDEATEAVSIFQRAISERVLPTPFLYNAVIGKLAKARRVDDCLAFFSSMRLTGVKPTSVTYGTMINALTRVGDEKFAEELFNEMESMPNYKPRPAPYNSVMQFFITTKRDREKVLSYYNRMLSLGIAPTGHTFKLLIDAFATLDKPDMVAAENVLNDIVAARLPIESSHHAALIHAKGCVLHDADAAITHFKDVIQHRKVAPDSTLYQALLESLVANHRVAETPHWVEDMVGKRIQMTPYIANSLIQGWTREKNIKKAKGVYDSLGTRNGQARREPSTYEAMTRAYLAVEDKAGAKQVADEMMGRGYPAAVVARVVDLVRMSETFITSEA